MAVAEQAKLFVQLYARFSLQTHLSLYPPIVVSHTIRKGEAMTSTLNLPLRDGDVTGCTLRNGRGYDKVYLIRTLRKR